MDLIAGNIYRYNGAHGYVTCEYLGPNEVKGCTFEFFKFADDRTLFFTKDEVREHMTPLVLD